MKILIKNGRVIDPASNLDSVCDVALAAGRIIAIGRIAADFTPNKVIDATGCIVAPGLVDLAARLREPGHEHEGMLESEMAAAVAGGVTSLVCPPDTDPVLDEPGLVEMLKFRAEKLHQARVFPLGALTRKLEGEILTEMVELTEAGCVGFSQAEVPLVNTQVMQRALQYATTFGYTVWLRPQEIYLGTGVAASGPLATRLGLSGVPVMAETIALHTIFELMRATGARVHLCRISSAAGVALVRQAKDEGLNVTCDVSINSLHLTDADIGYFDSRARLSPPLRQQRDRDALREGLADGTIDALVSDHTPVDEDAKTLPFAEAEPGATGLELLLSLALKWGQESGTGLTRALAVLTSEPARVLGAALGTLQASAGQLVEGGVADLCVFDPQGEWAVEPGALRSQGKHTPFSGYELPGRVRWTIVGGQVAWEAGREGGGEGPGA
ncbi:MAG: dihydroorotase [Pseudomonadota bacterium]